VHDKINPAPTPESAAALSGGTGRGGRPPVTSLLREEGEGEYSGKGEGHATYLVERHATRLDHLEHLDPHGT
jgi:hypothetical protein